MIHPTDVKITNAVISAFDKATTWYNRHFRTTIPAERKRRYDLTGALCALYVMVGAGALTIVVMLYAKPFGIDASMIVLVTGGTAVGIAIVLTRDAFVAIKRRVKAHRATKHVATVSTLTLVEMPLVTIDDIYDSA